LSKVRAQFRARADVLANRTLSREENPLSPRTRRKLPPAALLLAFMCALAPPAAAQETGPSIHPNPRNASLELVGENHLVWRTALTVRGTEGRHLPRAVFRYYVQGHPTDVVPPVYEMTARLGGGARVLGVVGPEATLVLAEYGKTVLVNTSEALGLADPREAVREVPSGWYEEPKRGEPSYGVPHAAYEEGVVASDGDGRRVFFIPWTEGRAGLDARRKVLAGTLVGLEEFYSARDIDYQRRGDLIVFAAGRTLHVFDCRTKTAAAHPLPKEVFPDPVAFDGELVVFDRREGEGSVVYEARTGRRLPGSFMPGVESGHVLGMREGVVYAVENDLAPDAEGRFTWRVSAYDLRNRRHTNLGRVGLKLDRERSHINRLFYQGQLFFWNEDAWKSISTDPMDASASPG